MTKQCVRWKTFKAKTIRNTDYETSFADLIDLYNRGTLLTCILQMEKKTALGFEQATLMAHEEYKQAFLASRIGSSPGESFWYLNHFVEWISSLGYHIEITGDEFEPYCMSAQLS